MDSQNIGQAHHECEPDSKQNADKTAFYSDLQDTNQIRLLHLQPRSSGEEITCLITNAEFSKEPRYEALSYMWGTDSPQRSITINETYFDVRENLWFALSHLRLESEVRILWIDAICINQDDINERNHQVTQMGRIYSQAACVIVWLGISDDPSVVAFQSIHPTHWGNCFLPSNDAATNLEMNKRLESISPILTRGYWRRLWIIQELLMAKDFVIKCGSDQCSRFRMAWFLATVERSSREDHYHPEKPELQERAALLRTIQNSVPARLFRLLSIRGRGNFSSPFLSQPLFKLFSENHEAECGDERDKILGLRSLAASCCQDAVPVDYSLEWSAILKQLIKHQISNHTFVPKSKTPRAAAVGQLQKCYRDLGVLEGSSDMGTIDSFDKLYVPHEIDIIQIINIAGFIRGRVCYTTPELNSLSTVGDCYPLEFTASTQMQMNFICNLQNPEKVQHPCITSELDIVGKAFTRFYKEDAGRDNSIGFVRELTPALPRWPLNSRSSKDFRMLLDCASKAFPSSDCVLAFEENGLIFFASRETRVGDLVCQFLDSDILVTLRSSLESAATADTQEIIGIYRAVNFLAGLHDRAADICGKSMSFDGDLHPFFTVSTNDCELRQLCRASKTPNGKHNIPNEEDIERSRDDMAPINKSPSEEDIERSRGDMAPINKSPSEEDIERSRGDMAPTDKRFPRDLKPKVGLRYANEKLLQWMDSAKRT